MDAGHEIAERLFGLKLDLFGESGNKDVVILAVPRGGIIIGDIVASELAARLKKDWCTQQPGACNWCCNAGWKLFFE